MFAKSNKPDFPAKHSIKHIRRLSKAITGALYPVVSGPFKVRQFFDIQTACREYDYCQTFNHLCYDGKKISIGRMDRKHRGQRESEALHDSFP